MSMRRIAILAIFLSASLARAQSHPIGAVPINGGGGGGGITGLTPGTVPVAATSSTIADSPITVSGSDCSLAGELSVAEDLYGAPLVVTNLAVEASTDGGTLAAGDYYYYVQAENYIERGPLGTEVHCHLAAPGTCTLTWTRYGEDFALPYVVWRGTTSGGESLQASVSAAGTLVDDGGVSFNDFGPPENGAARHWSVEDQGGYSIEWSDEVYAGFAQITGKETDYSLKVASSLTGSIHTDGAIEIGAAIISSGSGVPSGACNGVALYIRTGSIAATTLYVCNSDVWTPK